MCKLQKSSVVSCDNMRIIWFPQMVRSFSAPRALYLTATTPLHFVLPYLNMSSDQLKMYKNASKVDKLLLFDLPNKDHVTQIGAIVVCKYLQQESIAIVMRTMAISNPVHVPVILLSTAAEFQSIYGGSDHLPRLSCISENDPRTKASFWYEPPPNIQSFGTDSGM